MPATDRKDRPYHHGNLHAELVEAGLGLLRDGGPDALTTRACAKPVGVAPSAVFRHFADRRALATTVATEGFRLLGKRIAASKEAAPPEARMRAIGEAYLEFATANPHLFRLMFRGDAIDVSDPDLVAASEPLLRDTSEVGGESLSISDRAIFAWGVVHGLATLSLDSQLDDHFPAEREARRASLLRIMALSAPVFAQARGSSVGNRDFNAVDRRLRKTSATSHLNTVMVTEELDPDRVGGGDGAGD